MRKDSTKLRKLHFLRLAHVWGYRSHIWRLRNGKRAPASFSPSPPPEDSS